MWLQVLVVLVYLWSNLGAFGLGNDIRYALRAINFSCV